MSDPLSAFSPVARTWLQQAFAAPTSVQLGGWPEILAGRHVLMCAPTGSGKTLAAFLGCLDRLGRRPPMEPGVRVIYVSPLKALVADIERNLRGPLAGLEATALGLGQPWNPLRIDVRTGDTPARDRVRQRKDPAEILVTTPESLFLLLGSEARETLRTVETVIVDEIHVMAASKRGVHLALSLERLAARCLQDPQRVGLSATQRPLSRIARYLGGDREVVMVDHSAPPRLDLQVVVPIADMDRPVVAVQRLPQGLGQRQLTKVGGSKPIPSPSPADGGGTSARSGVASRQVVNQGIWPALHGPILERIRAHRSTIVFVNGRQACERLAQSLNDLAGEELVQAHHGSISHHQRSAIEESLKSGRLRGLVATSTLELGIDMGAVDQVLLVESPGSAARGLQRVGRAGHSVGEIGVGRIFPKYKGDLLECAVIADQMRAGLVEPTVVPANCLDVLAQQIVGAVAMDPWKEAELYALVRRASPYAELPRSSYEAVLDMLSGHYPSDAFADLRPRIVWDRTDNLLTGRKGARSLAILNAGTIPDRGTYRVTVGEKGPRIGELDEEMVFETRKGDNLILGASTWRVENIHQDVVVVSPAPGEPGRLPFWLGDRPPRLLDTGRAIGAFLRELDAVPEGEATSWVERRTALDPLAARNLVAYVADQKRHNGCLPTDRAVTIEKFRDELGDWRVCLLTPFGAKVHAPWAMAIEHRLGEQSGFDVQCLWTDDGIAVRFADTEVLPGADAFLIALDELEDRVLGQLSRSALFGSKFREAAGRALLLPRNGARGRQPLWMQRRRAGQLQGVAQRYPAFPIVLETFRECLQDVFDLPALREVLGAIHQKEIRVDEVEAKEASPFARSLVFRFVAEYLYDGDTPLAERRAQALTLDRNLLRELMGEERLRELLDPEIMDLVERELQGLAEDRQARDADELHDLLRRLGDLRIDELAARSTEDPTRWLDALARQGRALWVVVARESRWIASDDAGRYAQALGTALPAGLPPYAQAPGENPLEGLLLRYLRHRGPTTSAEVAKRYGLVLANAEALLTSLVGRGLLVAGAFRREGRSEELCDPDVLRKIRRRSLDKLRQEVAPVDPPAYARFLARWQGVGAGQSGPQRLPEVLVQLEGLPLAFSALEDEVLPARVAGFRPIDLDHFGAMGGVVWVGRGALGARDGRVALYRREAIGQLLDPPPLLDVALPEATEPHRQILEHLESRGASFLVELQRAAGNPPLEVLMGVLWDLVWAGLITNDTFGPLRALRSGVKGKGSALKLAGGRWSAVRSLLPPSPPAPTARVLARIEGLFERWGLLCPAVAQAEGLEGGFTALYPALKQLEESGRVRRGAFVEGLGGAQFARPGAVDAIRATKAEPPVRWLDATDPANPWGSVFDWPGDEAQRPRRVPGAAVALVQGELAAFVDQGGKSWWTFPVARQDEKKLSEVVQAYVAWRDVRTLKVAKIDGVEAQGSGLAEAFGGAGFRTDYQGLIWTKA